MGLSTRAILANLIIIFGLLQFQYTEAIFTSGLTNEANKLEKLIEMQLEHIKKLTTLTDDANRHRRELIGITKKQVGMIDDMLDYIKKRDKKETPRRRRRPRPTRRATQKPKDANDEDDK